jgi:rod shape-determining protein MreD
MIMPRGSDQLLLPVNPLFIGLSLLFALGLEMLPVGRHAASPDLLALVLVFWIVHQPHRVGVGLSFVFGLLMDVHEGALLGQHALAYTLLAYFAITVHRRLLWFSVPAQALQILPLFFAAHGISLVTRLIVGGMFPGWAVMLAPLFEAALWPVIVWLLLAPQRRAPDPDVNRPL